MSPISLSPKGSTFSRGECDFCTLDQMMLGLKFDIELSSGILRPSVCFVFWDRVFSTAVSRRSYLAARRVKSSQMMLKWPKTSFVHFSWLFWRILKFSDGFEKIWCLKQICPLWPSAASCDFLDVESVYEKAKWHFWLNDFFNFKNKIPFPGVIPNRH